jgi:hypothetical protein
MSTATTIDVASLVDMDIAPQCEHSQHSTWRDHHGGPAKYLVAVYHCCKGRQRNMLICGPVLEGAMRRGVVNCTSCGNSMPTVDAWEILEVL